jgi:hypothetical protein
VRAAAGGGPLVVIMDNWGRIWSRLCGCSMQSSQPFIKKVKKEGKNEVFLLQTVSVPSS